MNLTLVTGAVAVIAALNAPPNRSCADRAVAIHGFVSQARFARSGPMALLHDAVDEIDAFHRANCDDAALRTNVIQAESDLAERCLGTCSQKWREFADELLDDGIIVRAAADYQHAYSINPFDQVSRRRADALLFLIHHQLPQALIRRSVLFDSEHGERPSHRFRTVTVSPYEGWVYRDGDWLEMIQDGECKACSD